jgi:hypothetical protein
MIQFIHIDALGHQPVEDGMLAVQPIHPAVLGGGGADTHPLQQSDGVVVLAVRDREGDGGLPVFRVGLVADGCFHDHIRASSSLDLVWNAPRSINGPGRTLCCVGWARIFSVCASSAVCDFLRVAIVLIHALRHQPDPQPETQDEVFTRDDAVHLVLSLDQLVDERLSASLSWPLSRFSD